MPAWTLSTRTTGLNKLLHRCKMTVNGYTTVALWAALHILIIPLALGWNIALLWEYQTWGRISCPACVHKVITVLLLSHGL